MHYLCRADLQHLRAYGIKYFVWFVISEMRERHRTKAYQLYTADMLFLCAVSLGKQVEQSFSEIMAEYDKPLSQRRHETTLEEAQACWEKTLADSKKAAEQNGGGET